MAVLGLAAGVAYAVPTPPGFSGPHQESPGMPYSSTGPYYPFWLNHTNIISTDFEGPIWDLNHSVCGDEFATGVICIYPIPAAGSCIAKNHAANRNCCPEDAHNPALGDPNEETGWSMSPSSRHCNEPSIRDINPFAGTQHMRFQYDPLGGVPTGCSGFASACRSRAITAQIPLAEISRTEWSYEMNISGVLGSSMIHVGGQDTTVGSVNFAAYLLWYYYGGLYMYSFEQGGFYGYYWFPFAGQYKNFKIDYNPCENTVTYYYAGLLMFQDTFFFRPPLGSFIYGGAGGAISPTMDTAFYTTDHFPGPTLDMDNHFVTNTPCSDACCDGDTGMCTDGVDQAGCDGPEDHWYENTLCSQLGTCVDDDGIDPPLYCYPPACNLDTGSCCDTSPGAGGAGPEGVCSNTEQAACSGPQRIWTRGADCGGAIAGDCEQGVGECLSGFCSVGHGKVGNPCTTSADCNVDGMCVAGQLGERCFLDSDCDVPAAPACLETTGACCNLLTGGCTENRVQGDCLSENPAQRVWTKGASCSVAGCNAVLGACCDTDTFGGCTDTTQAGCTCSTCNWEKLGTCNPGQTNSVTCTHTAIPTVSEWGLVVLTLLLLTGAKVYFGRRQAVA
jgi:hypothetical protein